MLRSSLKQLISPTYPPLPPAQSWSIAASALLTLLNSGRHNTLSSSPRVFPKLWQVGLKQWWGIESRDDAIGQLQWLTDQGHRVDMAEQLGHEPLEYDSLEYRFRTA